MPRFLRWFVLILLLAALVAGGIYAMLPQLIPVDSVLVVTAPMQMVVNEEGKTRIRERYVVSSPLTGRLRRITLDPGDPVAADATVLAVIEPTLPELLDARALAEAEARVRAAEAAVAHAGTAVERARAVNDHAAGDLVRMLEAYQKGAAHQHEVDDAMMQDRTSGEELRAAQFAHEIAKYERDVAQSALLYAQGGADVNDRARMPLYSPIHGVVLRVFQESVAVVAPGTPLIEVGDARDLEIVIDVLSTDAVAIRPGQRVIIDHWGGDVPLEGIVRLVEPAAFTKISALGIEEQRVNVIVDFQSPAVDRETLGDGFRIEAGIVTWEQADILQVPTSAAFRSGSEWAVFLIVDGRAVLRIIEIGHQNGRTTEVVAGLSPGDLAIIHPNDQLADGIGVTSR